MFHFDPTIQELPVNRESIAYLAESSNQPHVAVPGRQAQSSQAFVVALRTSSETVSIYVSLWLVLAREPAVWVYEKQNLPLSVLHEAVEEAWHFCESMGFMMDVVPADLGHVELARILSRLQRGGETEADEAQPVRPAEAPGAFGTPGPAGGSLTPTFTPSPGQLARLGRLLASF
ncbi:hypothetical protein [Vulgatibacter sp.]|uniref:hypothetical protein n=1 Tax=Vulgatibacter sp. TaxID=1971226 RepID=UPI003565EA91